MLAIRDPLDESGRSLPHRVTSAHEMSSMRCQESISRSLKNPNTCANLAYNVRFENNKIRFSLQERNLFIFVMNF